MEEQTKEQLAELIRAGRNDLYPVLWERVRRFVVMKANQWRANSWTGFDYAANYGGAEFDDLVQAGFLALVDAVENPAEGYAFLTCLSYHLRNRFQEACGIRGRGRDALDACISGDRPSYPDDKESAPLFERARGAYNPFPGVEHKIYVEQLHAALEAVLARIPEDRADAVRRSFYAGQTYKEIGRDYGVSTDRARQIVDDGLTAIRRQLKRSRLDEFLDDRINYYRGGGYNSFSATKTSSTERYALLRMELEEYCQRE